jgi:hypothetical protein
MRFQNVNTFHVEFLPQVTEQWVIFLREQNRPTCFGPLESL